MKKKDYVTSVQHGLEHVLKHQRALSEKVNFFLEIIESGGGDPEVCLLRLSSLAKANALVSWFKDRDLNSFKQWCYVDGKLEYALFSRDPQRWFPAYLIFAPVLSDNEPLIRWFSCNDGPFDMVRANDLRTAEFHGYQALLALRGDWETLRSAALKLSITHLQK